MTDSVAPELAHFAKGVTVPGNNAKHGLYSSQPIVRSLLSHGEAEAWDSAAIPVGASPDMEEVMREYAVQRYRIHSWEKANPLPEGGAEDRLKEIQRRLNLLHRPLRGALKAIEVQAGIRARPRATRTRRMRSWPISGVCRTIVLARFCLRGRRLDFTLRRASPWPDSQPKKNGSRIFGLSST